jgi:hypothetical protein
MVSKFLARERRPRRVLLPPQPTQTVGRFRLRSDYFACKLENFACETILFRQAPRKLLKSLGREIPDFAASCDFKGLRAILFRAFFAARFPIRPPPSFNFVSQNYLIALIPFQGKVKGESLNSHICAVPLNRAKLGDQPASSRARRCAAVAARIISASRP